MASTAFVECEFRVGVPPRQEVIFRDGTSIWLHSVVTAGVPDLFQRRLGMPEPGIQIDLRRLAPDLATDLPITATRDVPGMVHFALRQQFSGTSALLVALYQTNSGGGSDGK